MGKMICFDMDGTIADLFSVPDWKARLDAEDPTPYVMAPPLWDMEALREVLIHLASKGWEIRVISWLAKDSSPSYKTAVRVAKLDWLKRYNFPYDVAHLVQYGTTKADCVRRVANPGILIDDNEKVRNGWHLGYTIDPMNEDLIERLNELARGE